MQVGQVGQELFREETSDIIAFAAFAEGRQNGSRLAEGIWCRYPPGKLT